ncbi:hypothetical protein RAAC3_TM7C00001G0338 [Candidatus Saccharibacteria bacterium RAAC3_TM7_1]|nr:hypothetical protein RAAC3_TM7C00001G0338 [Candidatus Saccharibacteria bacterium RAAC3_TM7_1]HCZ28293.1 hypothetical protein [Candidatus Saccharibacteria bacterium]
MKLYLSHASNFDYQTELYKPLKAAFMGKYEIYFPHDVENNGQNSKDIIATCDLVIAEVSRPSTGQGIELGWANAAGVPIICFHQENMKPSGAVKYVAKAMFSYTTTDSLVNELPKYLE